MYGHKFAEQYGPVPNEAWTGALEHIAPEAAKHAVGVLIKSGSGFPPTLPEFIAAANCYRSPIRFDGNGNVINADVIPIERQRADPEKVKRNIQMLRETLYGVAKWPDDAK